jgi:hypothetical protein
MTTRKVVVLFETSEECMPPWVKFMLLSMGIVFIAVGVGVGVWGTRAARNHVAMLEQLPPLSATSFADQRAGTTVLVEGMISPRNPVVLRNVVAYVREELDVTTDNDGDRRETWRSDGRETPALALEAGGVVRVGSGSYAIERAHETWYDEATLGFDDRPRDGSVRYYGLVAGGTVTAYGTVKDGPEGNELQAQTLFGGTRDAFLASQRQATAVLPILGGIFGAVGFVLCAVAFVGSRRRSV